MEQPDKQTLAWAVISNTWPIDVTIREIIHRTPKGLRLRSQHSWSSWKDRTLGELCKVEDVMIEFATEAEAEAAVRRFNKARDDMEDTVARARDAYEKAESVFRQAKRDQRASALAAITGEQHPC